MTAEAVGKQIVDVLGALAEKLEGPAAHVYEVYVRQVWMEGAMCIAGAVLTLVMCLVVAQLFQSRADHHRAELKRFDEAKSGTCYTPRGAPADCELSRTIVLVVGACGAVGTLIGGLLRLWNPEFYAIKRLVDSLTGG